MSMYVIGDNTFMMAPDDDTSFALVTIKTGQPINWWKELHENALSISNFIVRYSSHDEAQVFVMCAAAYNDKEAKEIMQKAWEAAPDDVPTVMKHAFTLIHKLVYA